MRVYIVTKGRYSDYHIVGVYGNYNTADKVADFINGQVEKYELDKRTEDVFCYNVELNFNGEVEHKYTDFDYVAETEIWEEDKTILASSNKSYEHAIKKARDEFYKYKAEKENIT